MRVNLIWSRSAYSNDRRIDLIKSTSSYDYRQPHMSKIKTDVFCYPCIYMVKKDDEPTLYYSSLSSNGHFGVPKIIWGNGGPFTFTDYNGEYGLTPFAFAIADTPENLVKIEQAFLSPEFREFIKIFNFSGPATFINYKAIASFKQDFWREFV